MADSAVVRTRRSRAHKAGDHRHCSESRCPNAGQVEAGDDGVGLRQAIEAEFARDPVRLEAARALVELAGGRGQPAVSALAQLDRMVEAKRSGRSAASIPPEGPFTASDATFDLARWVTDAMLVERLDELGELVAAAGWSVEGYVAAALELARRIRAEVEADVERHKRAGWGNYAAGLVAWDG